MIDKPTVGMRIRYTGHVPGCTCCKEAERHQLVAQYFTMPGCLDDHDEFGGIDPVWDNRIGKVGMIVSADVSVCLNTVWVRFDADEGPLNVYITHLEEER